MVYCIVFMLALANKHTQFSSRIRDHPVLKLLVLLLPELWISNDDLTVLI